MNTSDIINLSIAIIAGIAAILTMVNINIMVKQTKIQRDQWEFSHLPVFKVIYTLPLDKSEYIVIIENTNNVYYKLDSISFTHPNVAVSYNDYGSLLIGGEEKIEGLQVNLEPEDYMGLVGQFILRGKDALGNEFSMYSKEINFDNYNSPENIDLTNSYLTKK